jgi:hypothetical protein
MSFKKLAVKTYAHSCQLGKELPHQSLQAYVNVHVTRFKHIIHIKGSIVSLIFLESIPSIRAIIAFISRLQKSKMIYSKAL